MRSKVLTIRYQYFSSRDGATTHQVTTSRTAIPAAIAGLPAVEGSVSFRIPLMLDSRRHGLYTPHKVLCDERPDC